MKLSTRKILGVELGVLLLMALLMLVPGATLRSYLQVGVLGAGVLVSWWLLGWAKPQVKEGRLAGLFVILAGLLFQIVWFSFLGLKLGFVHNIYGWSWTSIGRVFLPAILMIVAMEILRGQVVAKGHESRAVLIVTVAVLTLLDMIWVWPMYNMGLAQDVFEILMIVGFPALLRNIMLTYVAFWYDYRANIIYRLIMEMPIMLLPILPNVNNYLSTMFVAGLMLVMMVVLSRMHGEQKAKKAQPQKVEGEQTVRWKKRLKYGVIGVVVALVVVYMGLMCGLFKYHLLAVGSGSMEPNISRGDMVLVEKSDHYDEMEEGEILVYRKGDVVMVHRISEVKEVGGKFQFRTKGDANDSVDNWMVDQGDVIGVARSKIIAFGYPTLWLNELFNGGKV